MKDEWLSSGSMGWFGDETPLGSCGVCPKPRRFRLNCRPAPLLSFEL